MALDTFVAGAYSSSFNSVSCGITQRGYRLLHNTFAEMVNETDVYGQSLIDMVHRGVDVSCVFECKAYKAGSLTPFYPWGTLGVLAATATPIGRLASAVASAFVLTSTANTPAATSPASLTATLAILAPNSNLELLFTSLVRNVPNRLSILPADAGGGSIKHFVTTVFAFFAAGAAIAAAMMPALLG